MTKEELEQIEARVNQMIDLPYEQKVHDNYQHAYFLGNEEAIKAIFIASNNAHMIHELHMAKKTMLTLINALKEKM